MKKQTNLLLVSLLLVLRTTAQTPSIWGSLIPGPNNVGFKTIKKKDREGRPFLVSLWFPSNGNGNKMILRDYVETGLVNDGKDKEVLDTEFKHTIELPFLFNLGEISKTDYSKLLSTPVYATNAGMKNGKWPLIIGDSEPVSLFVTNEWLASQGFVVAISSANFPPENNDRDLYRGQTDALEILLTYMMQQSFIDTSNISALGFGGGTQASFYLSLKTKAIRCLINIEGGVFMPLSKTTLSLDYKPGKFKIPMLHIVNQQIIGDESLEEFNSIKSPKYRITILSDAINHHDFTVYGRAVNAVLQKRGNDAALANKVFTQIHELILDFINQNQLDPSSIKSPDLFRLEKF